MGGVKPEPIGTGEMASETGPAAAGAVPEPFCEIFAVGTAQRTSSARASEAVTKARQLGDDRLRGGAHEPRR